jgi:hypothetical protein
VILKSVRRYVVLRRPKYVGSKTSVNGFKARDMRDATIHKHAIKSPMKSVAEDNILSFGF